MHFFLTFYVFIFAVLVKKICSRSKISQPANFRRLQMRNIAACENLQNANFHTAIVLWVPVQYFVV